MDCYNCKYNGGEQSGTSHIACKHPQVTQDMGLALLDMIYSCSSGDEVHFTRTGLHVVASLHGFKQGWAFWPLLFDPIWIQSCDGFEAIQKVQEATTQAVQT